MLIQKYNFDVKNIPIISDYEIEIDFDKKTLIVEKLLEAYELAKTNIESGNITGRGFGANVCTCGNDWTLGTNFNNTRNEISSICAERSAILGAYNKAMQNFSKLFDSEKFNFKIKYICMCQYIEFQNMKTSVVPCEDCLSWLNTNRYFDDDTLIFAFELDKNNVLSLKVTSLIDLLPCRNLITSTDFSKNKKIVFSNNAEKIKNKIGLSEIFIRDMLEKTYNCYLNSKFSSISNQKIACSVLSNGKLFFANKLDWTRRWFLDPLEVAAKEAIEQGNGNNKLDAICYFGDEFSINNTAKYYDGLVSITAIGRIRQKYATCDTVILLNLNDSILVTTIGEYLPKKFIQGYKI